MTAAPARTPTAVNDPTITEESVAAYLRAHPGFLAARPDLFATLHPPARVHGAVLADHMAAMLAAARGQAARMAAQAEEVLAAGRVAASVTERVQAALLAALRATDVTECVAEAWPGLLGVDAAALCCESLACKGLAREGWAREGLGTRWRGLPAGTVRALLRGRPMVSRDRPADAALVHAEAALLAERDLLVQVPGERPRLLALVSRNPAVLPNTQAWTFLGTALAAMIQDSGDEHVGWNPSRHPAQR